MRDDATPDAAQSSAEISLDRAPVHGSFVLGRFDLPPEVAHRMSALGLRRGSQVRVVQTTVGGGRILAVCGARVAMGRGVLGQIFGQAA